MNQRECVKVLLDPETDIGEKADTLSDYLRQYELVAARVGAGTRFGRELALKELLEALPGDVPNAAESLKGTFGDIKRYREEEKGRESREKKSRANELRSLAPGTAVVIKNRNREDVVHLLELKRTRFVCEYPDGRRFSVPVTLFLRVHGGEVASQLGEEERERRELVRALAAPGGSVTRAEILNRGFDMAQSLIEEFAAAIKRIQNAPVGLSGGLMAHSLGLVKKVNPRDQKLVKLIPALLGELAHGEGCHHVALLIAKHPDPGVRTLLEDAIATSR